MTDYSGVFDNDTGQRLDDVPPTDVPATEGLPERLQLWAQFDRIEAGPVLARDLRKAADEIMRLQAALEQITSYIDSPGDAFDCASIAADALKVHP